jgi:hypothetical protein
MHLLWFLLGLYLAYALGYYRAKQKYGRLEKGWQRESSGCVVSFIGPEEQKSDSSSGRKKVVVMR